MDTAFRDVLGTNVFCYIDDIVICGGTEQEILNTTKRVLELCRSSGFYLRLDKSEWLKEEVKYLGHVVGRHGIKIQENKTRAI